MGILENGAPAIIICTRDRVAATAFYREVLGLTFLQDDRFASIFQTGGVTLRVSHVPDFVAHEHTILGFRVKEVIPIVKALTEKGVVFLRHAHMKHDDLGIWTAPDGSVQVAWLKDPDGNLLSITNV